MTKPHVHKPLIAAAKRSLAHPEEIDLMAETFKVLSDPSRLRIVIALGHQELCTFDIAQALAMSESAVSHQLRLLKSLRLVQQRKEGKLVFSSIDDEHIEILLRVARKHVKERI
jgi:DNA-binding transcriptional ArsR family regulator